MAHTPSIKKLQYLVKLHELQHFGRAAEACFVSQSTLSAGISNLESQLDRVLIERDRHSMVFTPVGLELVNQAKEILNATNKFVETAEKSGQFFESTIRLGIIPTIAPYILPKYLDKLSKHHPKLSLLIKEDITENLLKALNAGELDILIIALPYDIGTLKSLYLFSDPLRLIHHPKSVHLSKLRTENNELQKNSVLLLEDGHCLRNHILSTGQLFSSEQINSFSTNSISSIVQMVRYDMGVSYIPEVAIASGVLNGTDIKVADQVDTHKPKREIGFVWRESSPFDDEITQLGDILKKCQQ